MIRLPAAFKPRGKKFPTVDISTPMQKIVEEFSLDITRKHGGPKEAARFIGLSGEHAVQELQAILRNKDSSSVTEEQLDKMRLWLRSSIEDIRRLLAEDTLPIK